jgi:predicted ATP-grasp superfamily ATP-dependent carboligase
VIPPREPYLIVAVTGRALAASAVRGGHQVVVLDYFADCDTRALADACRSVVAGRRFRFDRRALLTAAQEFAPVPAGLVYGSGFEGRTGLLERLAQGRPLHGNRPDVVAAVRDPARFFPLLDQLGILHPAVRPIPPSDPHGWLIKQPGGAGGTHIRLATSRRAPVGAYYQRFEPGQALSVLFLANGRRARILGINRQWTAAARPGAPFLYGGAVGGVTVPDTLEREIRAGLEALVAETGLIGLNGLDFILREGRWSVLELNPRPTATFELYDPDYPHGLFDWHLRACQGELPDRPATRRAIRAHAVVHASAAGRTGPWFDFPDWCRDIPVPGTRFSPGDPICTVHAAATDADRAMALLRRRYTMVECALRRAAA